MVKLAEFGTTDSVQTVVKKLTADKANSSDEWLKEASKLLVKKHRAINFTEGPNLLPNPSLETLGADHFPTGWARRDYMKGDRAGQAKWDVVTVPAMVHSGRSALRCIVKPQAP